MICSTELVSVYESRAVFSYLQYSRNTSQLMPLRMDDSVSRRWGVNITIGSPILQLALFVPEFVWKREANDNESIDNKSDVAGKPFCLFWKFQRCDTTSFLTKRLVIKN